jgi:hypothetical protein
MIILVILNSFFIKITGVLVGESGSPGDSWVAPYESKWQTYGGGTNHKKIFSYEKLHLVPESWNLIIQMWIVGDYGLSGIGVVSGHDP